MSNSAINEPAYLLAYEREKVSGDFSEMIAFVSYGVKNERNGNVLILWLTCSQLSVLNAQRNTRG